MLKELKTKLPSQADMQKGKIIEVKIQPGERVQIRTAKNFPSQSDQRIWPGKQDTIPYQAVRSVLPNPEYQNELDPFREAINAAGKLTARHHESASQRGTRRWTEIVVANDEEVLLDVTDCNHVPSCIYGQQVLRVDGDDVVGYWMALLESLETVRTQEDRYKIRRLAKYFLYIDDDQGKFARIDFSTARP